MHDPGRGAAMRIAGGVDLVDQEDGVLVLRDDRGEIGAAGGAGVDRLHLVAQIPIGEQAAEQRDGEKAAQHMRPARGGARDLGQRGAAALRLGRDDRGAAGAARLQQQARPRRRAQMHLFRRGELLPVDRVLAVEIDAVARVDHEAVGAGLALDGEMVVPDRRHVFRERNFRPRGAADADFLEVVAEAEDLVAIGRRFVGDLQRHAGPRGEAGANLSARRPTAQSTGWPAPASRRYPPCARGSGGRRRHRARAPHRLHRRAAVPRLR